MKRYQRLVVHTAVVACLVWFFPWQLTAQPPNKPATAPKPAASAAAPREIKLPSRGVSPLFMSDNSSLLWVDGEGVVIWDLAQEKVAGRIESARSCYVVSADGKKLAAHTKSSDDQDRRLAVKIYDIATRQEIYALPRPPDADPMETRFRICGFDSSASKLFTATELGLQVWDVKTGKIVRRIKLQKPPYENLSVQSQDARYFTIENGEASVNIFDTRTETFIPLRTSENDLGALLGKPNGGYFSSMGSWSFSSDGRKFYGSEQINGALLEWSLPQGTVTDAARIPNLVFAKVSPDRSRVLVNYRTDSNTLHVLDRKSLRAIATLGPMQDHIDWRAISRDNRWVFVTGGNESRLWDFGERPSAMKKK